MNSCPLRSVCPLPNQEIRLDSKPCAKQTTMLADFTCHTWYWLMSIIIVQNCYYSLPSESDLLQLDDLASKLISNGKGKSKSAEKQSVCGYISRKRYENVCNFWNSTILTSSDQRFDKQLAPNAIKKIICTSWHKLHLLGMRNNSIYIFIKAK